MDQLFTEGQHFDDIPMSFFSWMNLTFDKASAASSIAWLNPFSPPYDTSTILMTFQK
jgi:hypothetical protein